MKRIVINIKNGKEIDIFKDCIETTNEIKQYGRQHRILECNSFRKFTDINKRHSGKQMTLALKDIIALSDEIEPHLNEQFSSLTGMTFADPTFFDFKKVNNTFDIQLTVFSCDNNRFQADLTLRNASSGIQLDIELEYDSYSFEAKGPVHRMIIEPYLMKDVYFDASGAMYQSRGVEVNEEVSLCNPIIETVLVYIQTALKEKLQSLQNKKKQ